MNNLPPDNLPSTGKTQVLNIDTNVAECLCYVPIPAIGLLAAILWLVTEPKGNQALRFQAVQSLVLAAVTVAASIAINIGIWILAFVPFIGPVLASLSGMVVGILGFALFGFYCYLAYQAYQRNTIRLPYVGDVADNLLTTLLNK